MNTKKIYVAIALWFAAGASYASFVDNRKADGVIEVNYKSIAVEDLVADIVPREIQAVYAKPELKARQLRISGSGSWQQLLERALAPAGLAMKRHPDGSDTSPRLEIYSIADAARAAAPAAGASTPATAAAVGSTTVTARAATPVPAAPAMAVVPLQQWEIKAGTTLRATLENWCDRSGYRLVWNVDGGFQSQGSYVWEGDFKIAVSELFAAIPNDMQLHYEITKNKLVMVTRGGK